MDRVLKDLFEKSGERQRLTGQLAAVVGNVADAISSNLPVDTEATVDGCTLAVREYHSNVGSATFLHAKHPPVFRSSPVDDEALEVRLGGIITAGREPGTSFYLHRDVHAEVDVADRDLYLWFANHLPAIIQAFEGAQDAIIAALRQAFETLRKVAEAQSDV